MANKPDLMPDMLTWFRASEGLARRGVYFDRFIDNLQTRWLCGPGRA